MVSRLMILLCPTQCCVSPVGRDITVAFPLALASSPGSGSNLGLYFALVLALVVVLTMHGNHGSSPPSSYWNPSQPSFTLGFAPGICILHEAELYAKF